jgi:hypothetical protein
MASKILPDLIKYIISEVEDAEFVILRTRLVKLLYLCDFYYYQSRKQSLTGLEWFRYKYGPYSFELLDITNRMRIDLGEEQLDFSSGHGIKYQVYDVEAPEKWMDVRQRHVVDRVIKKWGGEELNNLLDFVYCDTEPMQGVKFGQPLDFHNIQGGLRYSESDRLDLAPETIADIQQVSKNQPPLSKPRTFANFSEPCKTPNDEPLTPNITGKVESDDIFTVSFSRGRE